MTQPHEVSCSKPASHSLQHPSSVSALRADPPSPTRGEGKCKHLDYRHDCCTMIVHKHSWN
ncbi:hypothetical protein EOD23_19490 [Mesorhizobium sp. USDA-HM6]|nr:hypothetical protein EOD23_19490 [Mesorhizobium sp. USDA-HM6]